MKVDHRLFLLLTCVFSLGFSGKPKLSEPYKILARIQPPYSLVAKLLPRRYTVPVTLSGSIADEIALILDTIDIDAPLYTEQFDKKQGFSLRIANKHYPAKTRELLSGIINPIEMTEVILNAILKYGNRDVLLQLQNETIIESKTHPNQPTTLNVFLAPKGSRFCYEYRDMGAYLHESWLTSLSISIDTTTMLAKQLSLVKHSRTFTGNQKEPAPIKTVHQDYHFSYTAIGDNLLPAYLSCAIDSLETLSISATYRQMGTYTLFDERKITYRLPNSSKANLILQYGTYNLDAPLKYLSKVIGSGTYVKMLERAAEHSRKARQALNNGNIQSAIFIMKDLVKNYPNTPQAVEAHKLLAGLGNN